MLYDGWQKRQQEIRALWQQNHWLYAVAGFMLGLLIAPLMSYLADDAMDFAESLVPEALGIVFTVLFINALDRRREAARRRRELQDRLTREAGSPVNGGTAINAIRDLRAHNWLVGDDGLLKGVDLRKANLREANLSGANLTDANLSEAMLDAANMRGTDLRKTYLSHARMQGTHLNGADLTECFLSNANLMYARLMEAVLVDANLSGANLTSAGLLLAKLNNADLTTANLTSADLLSADLSGADLTGANLIGADLTGAHLEGAILNHVRIDSTTLLPDGTPWKPNDDLSRFGVIIDVTATSKPDDKTVVIKPKPTTPHDTTTVPTVEAGLPTDAELAAIIDSDFEPKTDTQEVEALKEQASAQQQDDSEFLLEDDDLIVDWPDDIDLHAFDQFFDNGDDDGDTDNATDMPSPTETQEIPPAVIDPRYPSDENPSGYTDWQFDTSLFEEYLVDDDEGDDDNPEDDDGDDTP